MITEEQRRNYWFFLSSIFNLDEKPEQLASLARDIRSADLNWDITIGQSQVLWKELLKRYKS